MYFESHAHYDDKKYNDDRESLLNSLPSLGVKYVINVGADMQSSKESVDLAEKYDFVYATVGVHPSEVKGMTDNDIDTLREYTSCEKVVGIGEIGLDYYRETVPRVLQKRWFKRQLELVEEVGLPVIIHSRDASEDTFDMIKESKVRKGVVHCYSGSAEMALEYVKMGYHVGIGGVITFSNAKKLVEVVSAISLESILIETDCPYLAPEPFRGERNDSSMLKYVVEKIAEIKNISSETVEDTTLNNAKELFSV